LGQDFVASMYWGDHTHTSQPGAKLNAFIIAQAVKNLKNCKMSAWVK